MKLRRNVFIGATFVATLAAMGVAQNVLEQKAEAQAGQAVQAPRFEVDPMWPLPLPNGWYLGQVIGVWVDNRDHVWIIHRSDVLDAAEGAAARGTGLCCKNAPPIIEFDAAGKVVSSFGGPPPTRATTGPTRTTVSTWTTKGSSGSAATAAPTVSC